MDGITRMIITSLVFYVVAMLVQCTWVLLNLDIAQLIRRL